MTETYLIHNQPVKAYLLELAQRGNKKFTESLHPGVEHILGLRIPDLRKIAQEIAHGDWQSYLESADTYYMEERMLQGFVIAYIPKLPIEERLKLIAKFVPIINSWSVCDSVTLTFKFANKNREMVWTFIQPYLSSNNEYEIRFGIIMLLGYFVNPTYLPQLFQQFNRIHHNGYYVKMAIAWAVSVCFIKYPIETESFLKKNQMDDFTQNKSIQKIRESFRVDKASKERINQYKR